MPAPTLESPPSPAPRRAWRRVWDALHSRFARHIALGAVAIGIFTGVGHFVGGMLGWWHLYEAVHKTGAKPALPAGKAPVFSVVVLPLAGDEAGADARWFQDAVTADLTGELGRVSGSLVISRDTAATFAGKAVDPREVARQLGVRYVVRGTVQNRAGRVRLELTLIDGDSGAQRWTERVEIDRARLGEGVEDVSLRMARSVQTEVYRAGGRRLAPQDLDADDLAMQGWSHWFRGLSRENLQQALSLFEAAVAKDPQSVRGWGGVAVANGVGRGLGWAPDRDAALRRLREAADRLQRIDENDPFTLIARSNLHNHLGEWEATLSVADRMIAAVPSYPQAHFNRGLMLMNLGRLEDCVEPAKQALRISPRDPLVGLWNWQVATCHFLRGEYGPAAEFARTARQLNPRLDLPPLVLAAALARSGREDEARTLVAEHQREFPQFRLEHVSARYMRASHPRYVEGRDRLVETLRELGMQ